jgi:RNA polymerase sigma factor (sigma-70 family)
MARGYGARADSTLPRYIEAIRRKLRQEGVPLAWLDDLTQSVLLTWVQKGPHARRELQWLLDVTRKKAANWRRRYHRVREATSLEDLREEPIDEMIDLERAAIVHEAIATFTPRERAMVEALAAGFSMSDVAAQFGVAKGTVHLWIVEIRGRAALRGLLARRRSSTTAQKFVVVPSSRGSA